jgi:esterase/lipase
MPVFRTQTYPGNSKHVIFLLPGWHIKTWMFWLFAKILQFNDYHCLLYEYNDDVLSPDTKKTVTDLTLIRDDILTRIISLKKTGYTQFSVFGTSLGSTIALMAADKSPDIKHLILNLIGFDMAETVWSWNNVFNYFKHDLIRQGVNLKRLQAEWKAISPRNNINGLRNKQVLIYLAKKDGVIPFHSGLKLVKAIKKKNYKYKLIVNPGLGHFFAGTYNLIKASSYLTFLKN